MQDAAEPATADAAAALLARARALLKPSEERGWFGQKYFAVIHRGPVIAPGHREVTRLLSAGAQSFRGCYRKTHEL